MLESKNYAKRVRELEEEGLCTSDAQSAADVEEMKAARMSYFQRSIVAKGLVPAGVDPRHIEGYIRLQHSILGDLSWAMIRREVKIALGCIEEGGQEMAERNAVSYGL